ncbi:MAG: hypothetical protein OYL41_02325 [Acidobacteriota bacterium]|nr:hypothetical protein [Acidobacteriota bacterium]
MVAYFSAELHDQDRSPQRASGLSLAGEPSPASRSLDCQSGLSIVRSRVKEVAI